MSLQTPADILRQRFADHWTQTPIAWENVNYDPASPGGLFAANEAFVVFEIKRGEVQQVGFGNPGYRRFREKGYWSAKIFVPSGTGISTAEILAENVAVIFRAITVEKMQFYAPRISSSESIGNDGRWYQLNVTGPWQHDSFY